MSESQFEIKLSLNPSGVIAGVNRSVESFQKLGESVKSTLEAIGIKELIQHAIESSIEWGAAIQKSARASGIAVNSYQELGAASKELSIDVADATNAFKKLQLAQVDAIKGDAETQRAFQRIGISVATLRSLNPYALFTQVGEAIEKLPPSAQLTADSIKLMGKNSEAMVGAFRGGFIAAMKEASELGEILDEKVVAGLVRADDAMTRFSLQAKVAIASLIPPLVEVTGQILDATQATILWIQTWFATKGTRQQAYNEANKAVDAYFDLKTKMALEKSKYENPNPKPNDASNVQLSQNPNPLAKMDADKLLQIGGYRGGGEVATIPSQQLEVQRTMEGHLRRIAHYAEGGFASGVADGEVKDLLQKVDNFFKYGFGEWE